MERISMRGDKKKRGEAGFVFPWGSLCECSPGDLRMNFDNCTVTTTWQDKINWGPIPLSIYLFPWTSLKVKLL